MTTKRNQYTREFKLEAISLVTDHNRSIPDVSDSLGIGKSTLQKWLSQTVKKWVDKHLKSAMH